MPGSFFSELGKRLAERWLTSLILPGLLFVVAAWSAGVLGNRRALDRARLLDAAEQSMKPLEAGTGKALVTVVAALFLATITGLTVKALAGAIEIIWTGQWRGPFRPLGRHLTNWRRNREEHTRPAGLDVPDGYRPAAPTWMGDRLGLVRKRVDTEYGCSLDLAWPRLWLLLDDTARAPVNDARRRLGEAAALAAWGVMYLSLGTVYWPAAAAGASAFLVAWRKGRAATDAFAALVEAVVDLNIRALAEALSLQPAPGRLPRSIGVQINDVLDKGTYIRTTPLG
ncbi:hypothetical protein [Streptomyces sp. S.PB5]|uniref:hypothetical protein n=1 Tax=Streptomyces sp. S.PB5 TaxID=3020844 RepID=UPI0025B04A33|nr:hypothetical protein [Streptomyces sp. S.PB5]MDN3027161.1 hypothetical protein [Streptomyces sp. S.PB5]